MADRKYMIDYWKVLAQGKCNPFNLWWLDAFKLVGLNICGLNSLSFNIISLFLYILFIHWEMNGWEILTSRSTFNTLGLALHLYWCKLLIISLNQISHLIISSYIIEFLCIYFFFFFYCKTKSHNRSRCQSIIC